MIHKGEAEAVWRVLQTAPRQEPAVGRQLSVLGLEPYFPEFPAPPRTRAGSVRDRRRRPVFPGYLFFRTPPGYTSWQQVRWAPGVVRVLGEGDRPALIADGVVDRLRRRIASGVVQPRARRFLPGEPVVIESGPLAAVDAIFDRALDTPARVQVLVQLMGRQVPIRVDPDHLHGAMAG